MSEESSRQDFEKWIMSTEMRHCLDPLRRWISNPERYSDNAIHFAWEAWQESRRQFNTVRPLLTPHDHEP